MYLVAMVTSVILCPTLCRRCVVFFKQRTAYEMRISDWSSDVCSSDLRCCKDRCLQRSIALQHLLARNGFESSLVFGVRLNPFHAHCWLQNGDLILNDTLEVVGPFKALRAVG